MYFNIFATIAAFALVNNSGFVAAAPTEASTAVQGQATFVSSWQEAGLTRYRFYYTGVDGVNFVHAFQNCGGITSNWQSWNQDGHGVFDDSEVDGIAGARTIACGIKAITGQDCHSINEIGC